MDDSKDKALEDILFDSSRKTIDLGVQIVGHDPVVFRKFFEFALEEQRKFTMRAARVVSECALEHPDLLNPYLKELIAKLPKLKDNGLKRSLAKTFAEGPFEFDEESTVVLIDTCFRWLNNPEEEIAIRVYAMEILYKISNLHREIKLELIPVIEQQMPFASKGIQSRGRKLLAKLYREV